MIDFPRQFIEIISERKSPLVFHALLDVLVLRLIWCGCFLCKFYALSALEVSGNKKIFCCFRMQLLFHSAFSIEYLLCDWSIALVKCLGWKNPHFPILWQHTTHMAFPKSTTLVLGILPRRLFWLVRYLDQWFSTKRRVLACVIRETLL